MRSLAIAVLIAALVSPAHAWNSPRQAIDEFLIYELNGGRLDGRNWKTYTTKYIAAPANYDEPGWDVLTVIKSWQVSDLRCPSKKRCSAKVEFILSPTHGLNDQNIMSHDAGGRETQAYELVQHGQEWLVAPEIGPPRVLEATYRRFRSK